MATDPKVRRLITGFRRNSDHRDAVADVTSIPFEDICKAVPSTPADPQLYDCYALSADQLATFQECFSETIDTAQYDYYLEAEAE